VITEEIRALWRVGRATRAGKPMPVALREARVWGARADLLPRALRRVQPAQLEASLLHAARVDRLVKGIGRGDAWDELLHLSLGLMPEPSRRASG
jgi:DNA polymerase-3 subunit delta